MIITGYQIACFFIFLWLFFIWTRNGIYNQMYKLVFLVMLIGAVVVNFHLVEPYIR